MGLKMKTTKLVIGILSIILSVLVFAQSSLVGLGNVLSENGEASGTGGLLVSITFLIGGIVSVASRKSRAGGIAAGIFFLIGGAIGYFAAGTYFDLRVWGYISYSFGCILTFLDGFYTGYEPDETT